MANNPNAVSEAARIKAAVDAAVAAALSNYD